MKFDVVKVCAGLVIILALLMGSGMATETTWRFSGFELYGYDINFTNMNASNVWVLDFEDNGVPSISDSDSGKLYYNDTNATMLVSVNGSAYSEMQTADMKNVAGGIAAIDAAGALLVPGSKIYYTRDGSNDVHIYERTSDEEAYAFHRVGANDYTLYVKESNVWKRIQSESMKNIAGGIVGLDSNGDLDYNEKNHVFNRTLSTDNTASGDIITVTFGENVQFGQMCYPNLTDDEWKLTLATNAAVKHPGMGIALESKGNGETGKLLLRGTIRNSTYFGTAVMGDIVYLSDTSSGNVTFTAPSDSGDIVQILGFGLENNYIYFNPDYTYVEIA